MMDMNADAEHRDPCDHSALFAALLRSEFQEKAVHVAEIQLAAAYGESVPIWDAILARLRP